MTKSLEKEVSRFVVKQYGKMAFWVYDEGDGVWFCLVLSRSSLLLPNEKVIILSSCRAYRLPGLSL